MGKKEEKAAAAALEIALRQLPAIVDATQKGSFVFTGAIVHIPLVNAGLVEINSTEVKPNDAGEIATRATEQGVKKIMDANANTGVPADEANKATEQAAPAVKAKTVVILDTTEIAIPDSPKRGGGVGRESIYPFKTMEVKASFFVPATADKPKPWENIASAVANAEKAAAKVKTAQAFTVAEDGSKTMLFEADGTTPKMMTVMKTVKSREKGKIGQEKEVPELVKTKTFSIRESEQDGVKGARVWRTT